MTEILAKASTVLLFGRVVEDVQINATRGSGSSAKRAAKSASLEHRGASHALADQIAAEGACLARIYAFAYEGDYFELARPTLYLVHGIGDDVLGTIETTGITATPDTFASDVRVWAYDKSDLSVRLDVDTGTLEEILVDTEASSDRLRARFSGQNARISGQNVRVSGQNARVSGQNARLRSSGSGD